MQTNNKDIIVYIKRNRGGRRLFTDEFRKFGSSGVVRQGCKPLSVLAETVLQGCKPLPALAETVLQGCKLLSESSETVSKGCKPLSEHSDAIFFPSDLLFSRKTLSLHFL